MKGIKKIDENVISAYRSLTITNPNLVDNNNWQIGTLKCNPQLAGLSYKVNDAGEFALFNATHILAPETITSELILNETIRTEDLANYCVTNDKIADNTINHIKIQEHTLMDREMDAQSITTRALRDGNVTDEKMAEHTLLNRSFSDHCIEFRNMCDHSIGTSHILDGSITENKLASEAVSNSKIKASAVTFDKIAPYTIVGGETAEVMINGQRSYVQGNIAQASITGFNLANYTINAQHIMDGAIINRCIGDKEIYGDKIAPKAITFSHIADKTITGAQIASNTITTDNYADRSISVAKVDNEIANVISNALIYDVNGNVNIKSNAEVCTVKIGSEDAFGKSMGDGSLRVYGDIRADRVYNMAYSDLAEGYIPGEHLEPGDIVEIRENGKVYKSFTNGINAAIVGVVSDEYAACYGATKEEILRGKKVAVALVGKVHVKVAGPIRIGEAIKVNNIPGVGSTWSLTNHTIGTALETVEDEGVNKILCLVRPS